MSKQILIDEALQILADLGLPRAQRNERSALTLLALIDLMPDGKWTALKLPEGRSLKLSPGEHSELIKAIVEQFAPRFAPGSELVYAGDTGEKMGLFDEALLKSLGVVVDQHGKMPDVVLYWKERNWLML